MLPASCVEVVARAHHSRRCMVESTRPFDRGRPRKLVYPSPSNRKTRYDQAHDLSSSTLPVRGVRTNESGIDRTARMCVTGSRKSATVVTSRQDRRCTTPREFRISWSYRVGSRPLAEVVSSPASCTGWRRYRAELEVRSAHWRHCASRHRWQNCLPRLRVGHGRSTTSWASSSGSRSDRHRVTGRFLSVEV